MTYEIVDLTAQHVRHIASRLREGDRREVQCTGLKPIRTLMNSFQSSHYRKAFFVDGQLAAIGGCTGGLLSPVAHPWLMTTSAVEKVPLTFVKQARREIAQMLEKHSLLRNYVDARYDAAIGFLEILGFQIGSASDGLQVGPQGTIFLPFRMERRP